MDGVNRHSLSFSKIPSLALSAVAYLFFWGVFDQMLHLLLPEAHLFVLLERLTG